MKITPIAVIRRFASERKAVKLRWEIISEAGPNFKASAGVERGRFRGRIEKGRPWIWDKASSRYRLMEAYSEFFKEWTF
jgi:hypothetical protein